MPRKITARLSAGQICKALLSNLIKDDYIYYFLFALDVSHHFPSIRSSYSRRSRGSRNLTRTHARSGGVRLGTPILACESACKPLNFTSKIYLREYYRDVEVFFIVTHRILTEFYCCSL